MVAEIKRASVFAIKQESTVGTAIVPAAAGDFIPLRPGASMSPNLEELTSDEIINSLGNSKSSTGKEQPEGTHPFYPKHSETAGTAPEWGLFLSSALGATTTAAAEYNTVAACTTSVINVDSAEGATFQAGEALLIQDGTNGYSVRNIKSIATDALSLNFNLTSAPGVGVELGEAILYYPATTGHPSFTAWMYNAQGASIEAIAGARTSSVSLDITAGQQLEGEVSYSGTAYYFNPVRINSSNKYIDLTDDGGTIAITLTEGLYKSPVALATHIAAAGTAACAASGGDDFTCSYSSSTGKFTIATTTGSLFSILWKTGTHGADGADNHVGSTIGFSDAADDTGALTYTSDLGINMASTSAVNIVTQSALTPSYNDADNIIVKSNELFLGDADDNVCRKVSSGTLTIETTTVDADSICAASGLAEKVPSTRTVTLEATLIYEKYEADLFDKFINNTSTQAMLNLGAKDSSGNWVPGKVMNVYFGNAAITGHTTTGDDFVQLDLTIKGYVTSSLEDVYINFV